MQVDAAPAGRRDRACRRPSGSAAHDDPAAHRASRRAPLTGLAASRPMARPAARRKHRSSPAVAEKSSSGPNGCDSTSAPAARSCAATSGSSSRIVCGSNRSMTRSPRSTCSAVTIRRAISGQRKLVCAGATTSGDQRASRKAPQDLFDISPLTGPLSASAITRADGAPARRRRESDPLRSCIISVRTMNRVSRPSTPTRTIYLVVGWSAVALGLTGVFLPGLPTTVFVIVGSSCFSRSSPGSSDGSAATGGSARRSSDSRRPAGCPSRPSARR